ncbi:uncharacterized protein LOC135182515 isoform X2 [Pogoniulus pusillus]|uniref:uncharacterized protein LOC135182515 isoform X2 n=1 Tax=Pogoniulus pusillus TaxID=488313 RepID=UPI0030B92CEA
MIRSPHAWPARNGCWSLTNALLSGFWQGVYAHLSPSTCSCCQQTLQDCSSCPFCAVIFTSIPVAVRKQRSHGGSDDVDPKINNGILQSLPLHSQQNAAKLVNNHRGTGGNAPTSPNLIPVHMLWQRREQEKLTLFLLVSMKSRFIWTILSAWVQLPAILPLLHKILEKASCWSWQARKRTILTRSSSEHSTTEFPWQLCA